MNRKMDLIENYIQKVDDWLPYPMNLKEKLLENLKSDVLEAINDSEENDPVVAFDDPYAVAESISKGQDWGTVRTEYGPRTWAFLIDYLIINVALAIGFAWWIYGVLIPTLETRPTLLIAFFTGFFLLVPYTIFWIYGYFVVFEKMFSKTPGKRLLGLSVYDESGVSITWSQALIRNITKVDIFLLLLELLIARNKKANHQRLLDSLANTIVVRKGQEFKSGENN
jgi:uncharacterized RDD family membrane protein YckC